MATLTTIVRNRMTKTGRFPIRIRIRHNKTEVEATTSFELLPKELGKNGVIKNIRIRDGVNLLLAQWREKIATIPALRLAQMSARDVLEILTAPECDDEGEWSLDFVAYVREHAARLIANGQAGTGGIRLSAVNSFVRFFGRESVDITEITSRMLSNWVDWIGKQPAIGGRKKGGRAPSLYITQLKAEYNRAKLEFNDEDSGIIRIPFNPFAKVKVSDPLPEKRSITVEQLRAIIDLPEIPGRVRYNLARDVFLLSFYLMGMNSADLFNAEQQPDTGRIDYERTKTKTRRKDRAAISVVIPDVARDLVGKYRSSGSVHYFRFAELYSTPSTFNRALGIGLKEVGAAIGVDNLQFYAARHTWATIAYNDAGIDKGVVSDALNHVDPHMDVTDRYIRKDWKRIDEASRKVVAFVTNLNLD